MNQVHIIDLPLGQNFKLFDLDKQKGDRQETNDFEKSRRNPNSLSRHHSYTAEIFGEWSKSLLMNSAPKLGRSEIKEKINPVVIPKKKAWDISLFLMCK